MRILERCGGGLAATVLGAAVFVLASGCGGSSSAASSATTATSTAATAPAASASAIPARLTFFPSVVGVKPTGVATLVAGCSGPPSTESCTFSFVLQRDGGGQVGVLGGRAPGSITGNLKLRLNAAGRRELAAGTLHVLATGTITTSAHLVTKVRRRITLKKR